MQGTGAPSGTEKQSSGWCRCAPPLRWHFRLHAPRPSAAPSRPTVPGGTVHKEFLPGLGPPNSPQTPSGQLLPGQGTLLWFPPEDGGGFQASRSRPLLSAVQRGLGVGRYQKGKTTPTFGRGYFDHARDPCAPPTAPLSRFFYSSSPRFHLSGAKQEEIQSKINGLAALPSCF